MQPSQINETYFNNQGYWLFDETKLERNRSKQTAPIKKSFEQSQSYSFEVVC